MTTTKKQAILHSIDGMNASETEQLLTFIRGLLYNPANDMHRMRKKAQGMLEIRRAIAELPMY